MTEYERLALISALEREYRGMVREMLLTGYPVNANASRRVE